ncbi:MAG: nickel pincer cofactor biosynthesis protein LarB [Lachnospiraceae bacterium]|nr:nickel pincer cofactor biosynthesis protein LarB [Lachnospiraceae bacterium]
MDTDLRKLLWEVKEGTVTVDEAELRIKKAPFTDIGFAKIDLHRSFRQGAEEVVYGAGKTKEQTEGIVSKMLANDVSGILITKFSKENSEYLSECLKKNFPDVPYEYSEDAKIGIVGKKHKPDGIGKILIMTGGTSDIPVAEEAAITAEFLGNEVVRVYDVGVAGIHRLLSHMDDIMSASVIIALAGMEGALASVVGGLADCPVIAVPTSVGYGASFEGLAALLSMLNCCASGVTVVNVDNGFGAGYSAGMINHMGGKNENTVH